MTYLLRAPGQNSGPGTFAVSPSGAGVCNFGMYDVYTNRSSAIAPLTVPVQVMGALQLNGGSGWSSNVALAFTTPTAGAQAVSAGKTYDAEQLAPSFPGSPCAGLATATTTGYSTQSTPSSNYTSASFDVAPAGAAGGGTCTLQVSDQYNEPSTTVSVSVASGLFVGDASLNPVGSVILVTNGSGGWVPQSLYLWKKFLANPFTGTVNYRPSGYNRCAGYAYVGPSAPSMGSSLSSGSSQDIPFTIYGSTSTPSMWTSGCEMAFSDNYGETTMLAVVVDPTRAPKDVYALKEVWINNSTGTPTTYAYSDTVKPCGNDPSQTTECGTITNLEPPGYQGPPSTAPSLCVSGCIEQDVYGDAYSTICYCYVQKLAHRIVESDTYEQYGLDVTTNVLQGYYHYPLGVGDMSTTWCQSQTGSSGSSPCDDKTSYNIPGVWYPNPSSKPTL